MPLRFEVDEDNHKYFVKPMNEKNKPLCKEWICKKQLMEHIVHDQMELHIINTK